LNRTAHKTDLRTRTKTMRFYPFVFNGKEKDHESGFHYYGARYYWSELLLEGSHTLINLDSEVSVSGRMPYNAGQIGSPSRHKAALKVATNETIELLKHIDTL